MLQLGDTLAERCNMEIIKQPIELLAVVTVKANPLRRARAPTDETALEVALQIEHQVESSRANLGDKRPERLPRVAPVKQDDLIDRRTAFKQRVRCRLDGPSEISPGKSLAQKIRQGQCASDIADGAVENDQNLFGIETRRSELRDIR